MGFVGEGPNDRVSYLEELGVRHDTLTQAEKDHLDGEGYLRLPAILTAEQVDAFRVRLDELVHAEGDQAGQEVHQEQGTDRLADLVNKGEMFQVCFTHPRVLAAVAHVLQNDLKLSSLNAREARPGEGLQVCTPTSARPSRPGIIKSATPSGSSTTSREIMALRASCLVRTAPERCLRTRWRILRKLIGTKCSSLHQPEQ
jgi:hypothetical protein